MSPLFWTEEELAQRAAAELELAEEEDRQAREEYELQQKREEQKAAEAEFCGEQQSRPDYICDLYGWDQPEDHATRPQPRRRYTSD